MLIQLRVELIQDFKQDQLERFKKRAMAVHKLQEVPMYKNNEGYPDPTAGRAIRKADKPPEEVINFRRAIKLMSVICHVRILGKVTVVDDKGRRW